MSILYCFSFKYVSFVKILCLSRFFSCVSRFFSYLSHLLSHIIRLLRFRHKFIRCFTRHFLVLNRSFKSVLHLLCFTRISHFLPVYNRLTFRFKSVWYFLLTCLVFLKRELNVFNESISSSIGTIHIIRLILVSLATTRPQ